MALRHGDQGVGLNRDPREAPIDEAGRESAPCLPERGARAQSPVINRSSAEDVLRAVAAEVGLGRAIGLLEGERARVHAVLRG